MRCLLILSIVVFGCNSTGGNDGKATGFERGELTRCLVDSGGAPAGRLHDYVATLAACRVDGDAECEAAALEDGGPLREITRAAREQSWRISAARGSERGRLE